METIRPSILIIFLVAIAIHSRAQKKNWNEEPYPLGNPVITHMYTADAAPHVMPDGRVWMVTSVDAEEGGGYSTMHAYHTFSSADLVNWIDHGEVLHLKDVLGTNEEPEGENWALWAPDMIYNNGKYYLYYPIRILTNENGKRKVNSYVAVAVSDRPDQRFQILNPKIEGTKGIDPSVFIDDDGKKYLYWGSRWVAELKDNMYELATPPQKLKIGTTEFMEAAWMHKRFGKYYYNYHTHYDKPIDPEQPDDPNRKKSRLDYSWGHSPIGPLSYGGILNHELGVGVENGPKYKDKHYVPWRLTQSNHGGIVTFHGKDYLFYHTSALSSWRQDKFKAEGTWTQRSVCIDEITYDQEGNVLPVQQTIEGVKPVTVTQPFEILLAKEDNSSKFKIKGRSVLKFENIDLGSGYYYFSSEVTKLKGGGTIQIRMDSEEGLLIGTIPLKQDATKINKGRLSTFLREAEGKRDVVVVVETSGKVTIKDLKFIAGSPKSLKNKYF